MARPLVKTTLTTGRALHTAAASAMTSLFDAGAWLVGNPPNSCGGVHVSQPAALGSWTKAAAGGGGGDRLRFGDTSGAFTALLSMRSLRHANLSLQLWLCHTLQACCHTCSRACLPAWMLENTLPRVLTRTSGLKRSSGQRRRRALPWLPAKWSPTETTSTSKLGACCLGGIWVERQQASGSRCCWDSRGGRDLHWKGVEGVPCFMPIALEGFAVPGLCDDACSRTSLQDLWPAVRPTSSLDGGRLPAAACICQLHHPSSSRRQ